MLCCGEWRCTLSTRPSKRWSRLVSGKRADAMNRTVLIRGAEARGARPPENGSIAIASSSVVEGCISVEVARMWNLASRELGSEARNLACGVRATYGWAYREAPACKASKD